MKHWNGGALLWAGLVLGNSVLFLYGTVIAPAELLDSYAVPKMLVCMFPWTGLLLKSCKDGISESSTEELRRNLYLLLWGGWNIDRMVREGKSYFAGWARVSVLTFVVAAAGCVWVSKQAPEVFFGGLILSMVILMMGAGVGIALLYFKDGWLAAWIHVAAGVLVFFILYVFLLPVAGGEKVAEAFSISIPSVHLLAREFF